MAEKKKQIEKKVCTKCNKVLPVSNFFGNRSWTEQKGKDAWCSACFDSFCINKETQQEYCWYNNRVWNEDLWEKALEAVTYKLANNPDYQNSPSKKKMENMRLKAACKEYARTMNLTAYYNYVDNTMATEGFQRFGETEEDEADLEEHIYSVRWHGEYTKRNQQYLEKYYAKLEEEYDLDTQNLIDYAMKVCKASLVADEMFSLYQRGKRNIKDVNDAMTVFDKLSKSSQLAQCSRKKADGASMGGSLSEITLKLEQMGMQTTKMVEWPTDVVDELRNDLRYTFTAIGGGDTDEQPS